MSKGSLYLIYHPQNGAAARHIIQQLSERGMRTFAFARGHELGDADATLLRDGRPVVVLVSDNFLKSVDSMEGFSELVHQIEARLVPVVVDGVQPSNSNPQGYDSVPTRFGNIQHILAYMDYWHEEYLRARKERNAAPASQLDVISRRVEASRKISTGIGAFLKYLNRLNPVSLDVLANTEYAPIVERLVPEDELTAVGPSDFMQNGVQLTETTLTAISSAPVAETPETLAAETPETPVAETPETPAAETPETPAAETPETPAAETPETPAAETPETPAVETPETPAAETPETPAVETPETPAVETPETPAAETGLLDETLTPADESYDWLLVNRAMADAMFREYLSQPATSIEAAIGQLQKIVELDSTHLDALVQLAHLYQNSGQHEAARERIEAAIRLEPFKASLYSDYADLMEWQGEYRAAGQLYKKALFLDEENADYHYRYAGLLAEQLHKYEKAEKYYLKALALEPEHPFAYFDLARLYLQHLDRPKRARKYYLKACKAYPALLTPENDATFGVERSVVEGSGQEAPQAAPPAADGRTVLITGATSGIGRACALRLAAAGCRLIVTGRRAERLRELETHIASSFGTPVYSVVLDVRDHHGVQQMLDRLPSEWQHIDVLINNAGLARGLSEIHEGEIEHWEAMIDTNVKGLLYLTRAIAPRMVRQGYGHIINIGSTAGKEVYPKGNVYCATKFAVDALTRATRQDLFRYNVRVSSVSPAHVEDTEFSLVRFDGDSARASQTYQDFQPLRAEDVAAAVWYVLSQPAHVNIQDIVLMAAQQASATLIHRSGR